MARDSYQGRTFAVQALRRRLEGRRGPAAAAFGCQARLYPHQVGNVTRVLADIGIRHLLADEVGLGKTVQALMVINAIRIEHPGSRICVLVPDALKEQWRDELLTRAHEAPALPPTLAVGSKGGASPAMEIDVDHARSVELVTPVSLRNSGQKVTPEHFDLLIVDEIHNLTTELRDHLARVGPRFPGLLLLSATPRLDDLARRLELLWLLEPARVGAAQVVLAAARDIDLDRPVRSWPADDLEALAAILDEEELAAAEAAGGDVELQATALRLCAHRRIVRSRREDFRGKLPSRQHHALVVEPLDTDERRERLIREYASRQDLPSGTDKARLVERATLSPASLRPRLAELVRTGADRDGMLERARAASAAYVGDAKLDELTDLLNTLWAEDPERKIIVVCMDNPTVDYVAVEISARLDEVGPPGSRKPLQVVRALRGQAAVAAVELNSPVAEAILEFQSGPAQLLCAGDVAEHGLNLQRASALIFYGAPRSAKTVEQWIGRLDRIGSEFVDIDVYTIALRGLLDEHVYAMLASSGVFARPLNIADEEDEQSSISAVERPVAPHGSGVAETVEPAGEHRANSALQAALPYGPTYALREYERLRREGPMEPALVEEVLSPMRAVERAKEGWLDALHVGGEYKIEAYHPDRPFRLFGYRFPDAGGLMRNRATTDDVTTTDVYLKRAPADPTTVENPRHPRHRIALATRRRQLQQPPRRTVSWTTQWGEEIENRLGYFDHGDLVHEALIEAWLREPLRPAYAKIECRHDHPLSAFRGAYWLTVGWLEYGAALCRAGAKKPGSELLERMNEWACGADARWLRGLVPPFLSCYAERYAEPGGWAPLPENDAWTLLKPLDLRAAIPSKQRAGMPKAVIWKTISEDHPSLRAHQPRAVATLRRRATDTWLSSRTALADAAAERSHLLLDEAAHLEASARVPEFLAQRSSRERDLAERCALLRDRANSLTDIATRADGLSPQRLFSMYLYIVEEARS